MKNVFSVGKEITLVEALNNRDERVAIQYQLLQKHAGNTLISLKMNIPGPIKMNQAIQRIFHTADALLKENLKEANVSLVSTKYRDLPTGPEGYIIVPVDGLTAKKLCIDLENKFSLSSMIDLDVYEMKYGNVSDISRQTLGVSPRQCFVCQDDAKACARSKKHSLDVLQKELMTRFVDYYKKDITKQVAICAQKALLYEVVCTPKPGLVDAVDSGSHDDMTVYTFIDSSCALTPYFELFFESGFDFTDNHQLQVLFKQIRKIGLDAEEAMNQATNQVNTHKGAIFSLGVLLTAVGYAYSHYVEFDLKMVQQIVKEMMVDIMSDFDHLDQKNPNELTIGERLFLSHNISGIRGEASEGYPLVFEKGLPFFVSQTSDNMTHRLIDTLLFLLQYSNDTNLIKRAGEIEILVEASEMAKEILNHGGVSSTQGNHLYLEMVKVFKERHLSIGGTADLLILTLFLYFIDTMTL